MKNGCTYNEKCKRELKRNYGNIIASSYVLRLVNMRSYNQVILSQNHRTYNVKVMSKQGGRICGSRV